jgi:uncharacterized protein with HEPN domain
MSKRDPAVSLRQPVCALARRRERPAGVLWLSIVGRRNRLIDGYDDIDHDIVWQIVTTDLPLLALELSRSLPDQGRDDSPD